MIEDKLLAELKRRNLTEISKTKSFIKNADRYERALYNYLLYQYPDCVVLFDHKLKCTGDIIRQLDILLYKPPDFERPFLVAECKRYTTRKIQIDIADKVIGLKLHTKSKYGLVAGPKGFSKNARNWMRMNMIAPIIIDLDESDRYNWREIARDYFPWDRTDHFKIADSLFEFSKLHEFSEISDEEYWKVIDAMDGIMFEEWESWFDNARNINFHYYNLLEFIAKNHDDGGWRFNAIQRLNGMLSEDDFHRRKT